MEGVERMMVVGCGGVYTCERGMEEMVGSANGSSSSCTANFIVLAAAGGGGARLELRTTVVGLVRLLPVATWLYSPLDDGEAGAERQAP